MLNDPSWSAFLPKEMRVFAVPGSRSPGSPGLVGLLAERRGPGLQDPEGELGGARVVRTQTRRFPESDFPGGQALSIRNPHSLLLLAPVLRQKTAPWHTSPQEGCGVGSEL